MTNPLSFNTLIVTGTIIAAVTLWADPAQAQRGRGDPLVQVGCTVYAEDMSFGSIVRGSGDVRTTAAITLACEPGVDFEVAIDRGLYSLGTNRRMMNSRGTGYMRYNIYRDPAFSAAWRERGQGTLSGSSGTGQPRTLIAYGEIRQNDVSDVAGTYQDTVSIAFHF